MAISPPLEDSDDDDEEEEEITKYKGITFLVDKSEESTSIRSTDDSKVQQNSNNLDRASRITLMKYPT